MSQARNRGIREDRIAQSNQTRQLPTSGNYISTKGVKGMCYIVEEVTVPDEEDAGFFLVSFIDEQSFNDMGALGCELDPGQWFHLLSNTASFAQMFRWSASDHLMPDSTIHRTCAKSHAVR